MHHQHASPAPTVWVKTLEVTFAWISWVIYMILQFGQKILVRDNKLQLTSNAFTQTVMCCLHNRKGLHYLRSGGGQIYSQLTKYMYHSLNIVRILKSAQINGPPIRWIRKLWILASLLRILAMYDIKSFNTRTTKNRNVIFFFFFFDKWPIDEKNRVKV